MEVVQFDGAWELKILTSKKVDCLLLSQKFWALTSSLAPSSVLVLLRGKLSPVSGCKVGSTQLHERRGHFCAGLELVVGISGWDHYTKATVPRW